MNSLIGMSIGVCILWIAGILKSSKEYHALKNRHGLKLDDNFGEDSQFHEDFVFKFEDFKTLEKNPNHPLKTNAEAKAELGTLTEAKAVDMPEDVDPSGTSLETKDKTEVVKVYANREAQKMKAISFSIPIGIALWIFYLFEISFWVDDLGFLISRGLEFLALFGPVIGVLLYYKRPPKKPNSSRKPILEFTQEGMTCHSYKCGSVQTIQWTDIVNFTPKLPNWGLMVSVNIEHKLTEKSETRLSNYVVNVIDLELVEFIDLLELHTGLEAERV